MTWTNKALTWLDNFLGDMSSEGTPHNLSIDWQFIRGLEGFSTRGYVPDYGVSGVTICSGFDLGQHNVKDLTAMGLDYALIQELRPYLMLQRENAKVFLAEHPLELTDEQATEIQNKCEGYFACNVEGHFNGSPTTHVQFDSLPPALQTVIVSVSYQYGLFLESRTPHFWKACLAGDIQGIISILRNFGDAYGPRRNKEADYLASSLKVA